MSTASKLVAGSLQDREVELDVGDGCEWPLIIRTPGTSANRGPL